MASIQKFETVKGNLLYVVLFDGETVIMPHQGIQNSTLALIRGNGVVQLSAGEIKIHGSAQFLYYNNKWNYIEPEVTEERFLIGLGKLADYTDQAVNKINNEINLINNELEPLQPLKPQECVLQIGDETLLQLFDYQAYKIGKIVFIYAELYNPTESSITLTTNNNILQIIGANLNPESGRIIRHPNTTFKAVDSSHIRITEETSITAGAIWPILGFLFTV